LKKKGEKGSAIIKNKHKKGGKGNKKLKRIKDNKKGDKKEKAYPNFLK
jgi:hypothetical protein